MEAVSCLLCGHTDRRVRFHGRDRLCNVPGEFTLVECTCCGFLYLSPRPDESEIGRFYPADYGPYAWTVGDEQAASYRYVVRYDVHRRCDVVLRHKVEGHLLDIGCGVGDFLAAMQTYPGWHVRGLEPSAVAAQRAREKNGVIVEHGYLEQGLFAPASFDVVTLWEVLEHVPQPLDTLREIHRLLRPGGIVVLSVPNRDSFAAKFFGQYWTGLDMPRHFSIFSRTHLMKALHEAGFVRARTFTMRGRLGAAHNELLFTIVNLHIWLARDGAPGRFRRMAQAAIALAGSRAVTVVPLFFLTLPYSWLVRLLNRGSQMSAVARKL